MTTWTPQELAAAVAVLAAAFGTVAVGLAQTYAQVRNIVEAVHRAGIPVRGAKGTAGSGASNAVGPRGATSAVSQLLPVDAVSQLQGVTVVNRPAPTGPVDCGPACVVSCIEELRGVWSADELLRLRYFGAIDNRLTTVDDLVGMLVSNRIKAHARKGISPEIARQEITRNWASGRPSIILGDWVSRDVGHWVKFLGDRGGAHIMDPYYGAPRVIDWATFAQRFYGDYAHVDSVALSPDA